MISQFCGDKKRLSRSTNFKPVIKVIRIEILFIERKKQRGRCSDQVINKLYKVLTIPLNGIVWASNNDATISFGKLHEHLNSRGRDNTNIQDLEKADILWEQGKITGDKLQ